MTLRGMSGLGLRPNAADAVRRVAGRSCDAGVIHGLVVGHRTCWIAAPTGSDPISRNLELHGAARICRQFGAGGTMTKALREETPGVIAEKHVEFS